MNPSLARRSLSAVRYPSLGGRMHKYTVILVLAMALCLSCQPSATPPSATAPSAALPAAIESFQSKVAPMDANAVLAEATTEFGQPSRDIGSGLSIPQWDIAGGVLTVHPLVGPTFRTANDRIVWLIPTSNPVSDNLLQDFEMTTLPDPANHGTRFWIGNVHITKDGTYRYVDSGSNLRERGSQSSNFFMKHPEGRVEIIYPTGVAAHSNLEDLGERQIATLRFVARDGIPPFECSVASSAQSRRLSIVGSSFQMEAGWLNFWQNRGRSASEE
jgi:hypothetical protein